MKIGFGALGKGRFDPVPAQGKIAIAGRKSPDTVQVIGEQHSRVGGKRVLGLDGQNRFPEDVPGVGMIDKSLRRKESTVKRRCRLG